MDRTAHQSATSEFDSPGHVIINADDWGRDCKTTDRIAECFSVGSISSVSAMTFMQDSERAAAIAQGRQIDTGLHLNFTTPFEASNCPPQLAEHQEQIAKYLTRRRLSQVFFDPRLTGSFEYVVSTQIEEYERLYATFPKRLDGHHHMHLCTNVLLGRLLPPGTIVRRNFSFDASEKSWANRAYRRVIDRILARRHHLTDFFFSLAPVGPAGRLQKIFDLARRFVVEVEAHPVNLDEFEFLARGGLWRSARGSEIARSFVLKPTRSRAG